jgi:hypothetical protein
LKGVALDVLGLASETCSMTDIDGEGKFTEEGELWGLGAPVPDAKV